MKGKGKKDTAERRLKMLRLCHKTKADKSTYYAILQECGLGQSAYALAAPFFLCDEIPTEATVKEYSKALHAHDMELREKRKQRASVIVGKHPSIGEQKTIDFRSGDIVRDCMKAFLLIMERSLDAYFSEKNSSHERDEQQ